MKMRYLVVDGRGQVRRVSRASVRGLWEGKCAAGDLGCPPGNELRLVSVVCDRDLVPDRLYLLRVPLIHGAFTEESRLTLSLFARPDCVTPGELAGHHLTGWPPDFYHQLAVALDVPMSALDVPLGVGGPLLVAAARGLTPDEAIRHLR